MQVRDLNGLTEQAAAEARGARRVALELAIASFSTVHDGGPERPEEPSRDAAICRRAAAFNVFLMKGEQPKAEA